MQQPRIGGRRDAPSRAAAALCGLLVMCLTHNLLYSLHFSSICFGDAGQPQRVMACTLAQ